MNQSTLCQYMTGKPRSQLKIRDEMKIFIQYEQKHGLVRINIMHACIIWKGESIRH